MKIEGQEVKVIHHVQNKNAYVHIYNVNSSGLHVHSHCVFDHEYRM